ncbi:phosphatase PAP2 family protein [Actinospongicola halichondriae]|uniref:phosphatase PAP2 family protein n=1 Tax=Actinospongicola halichondriae TaxID=3236844 RepID=UPI003D4C8168
MSEPSPTPVEPAVEEAERQHPAQAAIVHFDAAVDRALDHLRGNPTADRIFYTASELGDFSLIWHLVATTKGLRRGDDLEGTLRLVGALGLESLLVNAGIKSIFRRSRPVTDVPRPHRLRKPRSSSFPSGHASAATVFVVMASEDDKLAPLYVAAAATVAVSRIYVRIHHASDVVGGVVVGAALGAAMRRWLPGRR